MGSNKIWREKADITDSFLFNIVLPIFDLKITYEQNENLSNFSWRSFDEMCGKNL